MMSDAAKSTVNETLIKSVVDVVLKVGLPLVMVAGILWSNHIDRRDTLTLIGEQHRFCTQTVAGELIQIKNKFIEEGKSQAQAILWLKEMSRWIGDIHDRFIKVTKARKFGQPQPFPGATQRRLQVAPN